MTTKLQQMLAEAGPPPFDLTDWEAEYMAKGERPKSPPSSEILAPDGLPLAYREWAPDDWDGRGPVAILIPGSTSHSAHYSVLGAGLAKRGIFTRIIDVRGHGLSVRKQPQDRTSAAFSPREPDSEGVYFSGRIGDCLDKNQLIRDLAEHLAHLRRRFPFSTYHIAGHSSGGGILTRFIERGGVAFVDSVSLIAPVNHYHQPQTRMDVQARYALLDETAMEAALLAGGNPHEYVLGFNLGSFRTPISVTYYTATMAQAITTDDPHSFLLAQTKPLLWLVGEHDPIFDVEESRKQFSASPGGGRFAIVENTSHIGLSFSPQVVEELAKWFWRADPGPSRNVSESSRSSRRARPIL